jgi:hypothetical protein
MGPRTATFRPCISTSVYRWSPGCPPTWRASPPATSPPTLRRATRSRAWYRSVRSWLAVGGRTAMSWSGGSPATATAMARGTMPPATLRQSPRILKAALGQRPVLPSVKTHPFLCGTEFTSLAAEDEFFAGPVSGVRSDRSLPTSVRTAHVRQPRACARTPWAGELNQRVFGTARSRSKSSSGFGIGSSTPSHTLNAGGPTGI